MAKKVTPPATTKAAAPAASAAGNTVSTPVRNSAVPPRQAAPAAPAARKEITQEQIAIRAYEISRSGTGGSQEDNWFRAERELRAGL